MRVRATSLRQRLVLGAAGIGVIFAVAFGLVATWRVDHAESQALDAALQSRLDLARDQVASDGTVLADAGSPQTDLMQVVGPDGQVRSSTPSLTGIGPLVDVAAVRSGTATTSTLALQEPDVDLALLAVPLDLAAGDGTPAGSGALVVAVDAEGFNTASSQLLELLLVGLGVVLVAMTALAWVLTGRALKSVTRITEDAETVQPRDLGAGIPVPRGDAELTRLVQALNRMLERLHRGHLAELAFAADAGHRLRTPVATLRAEAELALRGSDPAALRTALTQIVNDADQLTSIVDRMLTRTRTRHTGPTPVLRVLAQAGPRWQRQSELASVRWQVTVASGFPADIGCVDLVEITEPIVDNAVRHTPPGGQVRLDVALSGRAGDADGHHVVLTVANDGQPIPADLAPHVFDAWVSSRDASSAGGLGLWLARESARDHGGEVRHLDTAPQTTFEVRLPAVAIG